MRWILFLLLLAALAWVFILRGRGPRPDDPASLGPGPDFGELHRLVVVSEGDSAVAVAHDDAFTLVYPVLDRADPTVVAELLRRARRLEAARVLENSSPARYGLLPARSRLYLEDEEGRSWSFAFGDTSPVASLVYGRRDVAGAPVVLVDLFTVRRFLLPDPTRLRDRSVIRLEPGPVDSVSVLVPGFEFRALRRSREEWEVRVPEGLRVEPYKINRVVELLRRPSIVDFPPPGRALADMGLDPPRAVWVLFQGTRQETVGIGEPGLGDEATPVLPSGRRPALVPSDVARSMVSGWPALADLHLLSLPADSIETVDLDTSGATRRFQRAGGGWVRGEAGDAVPRPSDLSRDLANLQELQWIRFPVEPNPPPLGAPRLRLRLASSARAETLELAAGHDAHAYARSSLQFRWGQIPAAEWRHWAYRAGLPRNGEGR